MYIKTQRLELKPIPQSCLGDLTELLTDEQVTESYMVPDFPDAAAAVNLALRLIAASRRARPYLAGIFLEDSFLGLINETESGEDWIELGYAILPQYHNQGYCTEALKGAVSRFLEEYREVVVGAFDWNKASIRVMEKAGLEPLERSDTVEYRGKIHTCVYYSAKRR